MKLLLTVLLLAAPQAGATVALAAHHAVYKLSLQSTVNQGVIAASGTMTYDVRDACSGWTTAQHLALNVTNRDGQDIVMVSDYATLEAKDGTKLDFHTKQLTDQAVTSQLDGSATLNHTGGKGEAAYTSPSNASALLPLGTLLPMAHTAAIIDAAQSGKKFLSVPLFDGTGAAGAEDTFVTIEGWHGPQGEKWAPLAALPSGRVHIAFFERDKTSQTPDYEIGMRYFQNGVADDLSMNFGDFVMTGKLDSFELAAPPKC